MARWFDVPGLLALGLHPSDFDDSGGGGGGGGIGGSIADQQVAFGDGTDIAGSENFKWDDGNLELAFSNSSKVYIRNNADDAWLRVFTIGSDDVTRFGNAVGDTVLQGGNGINVQAGGVNITGDGSVVITAPFIEVAGPTYFDSKVIVSAPTVPATAGASGEKGEIAYDSGFIYVCVATNTWKRAALSTW